jgi:hypothetical protein
MPWTAAQTRFFEARSHGWVPSRKSLRDLSPQKAKELLSEAKVREEGQKQAIKRTLGR